MNPWEYLSALQRNAAQVEADPAHWLPWNYHEALAVKAVALAAG